MKTQTMKNCSLSLTASVLAILIICSATVAKAEKETVTSYKQKVGLWEDDKAWSSGSVPLEGETAVVTNGTEVTVEDAISDEPSVVRVGNNAKGGVLKISVGGQLAMKNAFQVATAPGSQGQVEVLGSLNCGSSFYGASNNGDDSTNATIVVAGQGELSWKYLGKLGHNGAATLRLEGGEARVTGGDLQIASGGTVEFVLDKEGASEIFLQNRLVWEAGAKLIVDGTKFEGQRGRWQLISSSGFDAGAWDSSSVIWKGWGKREPIIKATRDGLKLTLK